MKKFLTLTTLLLASTAVIGCSQNTTEPAAAVTEATPTFQTYSAEAFFQTTSFSLGSGNGVTFGPDSNDILLTSDETGVLNAYRMNSETGERTALTVSTTNPIYAVSWFPNDERMLYRQDGGGDELDHVFVRELDGSVKDLTPGENVKASFLGWADDKARFYLLSNERDPRNFDLYAYETEGYARELIYKNDGFSIDAISGDGRYIGLTKERTSADSDIYLVDLETRREPMLITAHEGNVAHRINGFSAKDDALYYGTNEGGEFYRAVRYDLETGEKTEVFEADWDVSGYGESPSGRYVYSLVNADALLEFKLTEVESGKEVVLKDLPAGELYGMLMNEEETKAAFIVNSSVSPSNIYVADLATGNTNRLTTALNPEIDQSMLVESEVTRFASYDGLEIPGILYRPKMATAATPVPAIVLVHGGPGGQSRRSYSALVQHLLNHGYAVYAINNRGSSGYGKTFYHMDDKRHGDVDLKDVVASKDYLAGLDWIDGERVGIMGGSYGGYMVAAALAFEPDVFDVGVNIFGVTNWVRTLESIPPWWESFREALYDEMGDPATDAERHRAISPLFHAENIVKPLLVVQGANDPRVLQVESDELVEAVRANGVPVEYVLFEDEGHGFRKRENRITASEAYLEFLDKHLK